MKLEILKNTGPTTLTKTWFEDGDQVDAGTVTYAVVDADGTSVASGTATKVGTGSSTTYTISLAIQTAVAELTVTWTRSDTGAKLVDVVSVVGSILFTEAEARAFDIVGGQNPLSDTALYSDQDIAEGRYRVAEFLERRCGVSFIRRYARAQAPGPGTDTLRLRDAMQTHGGVGYRRRPLTLLTASVNGTALTAAEIANVHADRLRNRLVRFDGKKWAQPTSDQPPNNVTLGWEYGYTEVPWEIHETALMLVLRNVVPSDVSSRATSFSNPDGTFRLSTPGLRFPTGVPTIDEAIEAHDERALIA